MSPSQPAVVTEAEIEAARASLRYRTPLVDIHPDFVRYALEAAAALRSDDVTTRLTEAADRVAKAEERAEKAEADLTAHVEDCDSYMAELEAKMFEQAAQIADLNARAEKAEAAVAHQGVSAQVARLTARAEKAEAEAAQWKAQSHAEEERASLARKHRREVDAQVADLTAKLDEARGVLRAVEWGSEDGCCPLCGWNAVHTVTCEIGAVLAPETGKADRG